MARRIEVDIVGDSRSLERAFRRSSVAGRSFSSSIKASGLAVGAALAGASVAAGAFVRSASSFEESLQKMVGLSGVAQGKIAGLREEVLKLAPSVGRSPQELAEALLFITSSGIKAADAMGVLTAAAKASAAGLGDTQVVADALTSAMNAYGTANLSANKAADVLVATVREGKGEASDFAGVIGNVTAIASQLGVSFEDVGAALAAMTRLGTDAETSATQLQQVFSNLVKVSPQQEKAFHKVGLSAAGLRKELADRGLLATLKTIQTAFKGNLPDLSKAFGDIRALRGVLALVGNQSDAVAGIFQRLNKSAGSLEDAFSSVSKTTAQRFRQLQASAKVLGIQVGAAIQPLANIVAKGLTAAAVQVSDFFDDLGKAHTVNAKIDVAISAVSGLAKSITDRVGDAVAKVDWDAVFAKARGVADGLQKQIEQTDFSAVGKRIGEAFADAVKVAIPATKDLANRINDAMRAIDWEKLGRSIGPGLATAVTTAFLALLDPAFWVRNWDLALAVALTAFGGSIGRVAGKVTAPLIRLGGDMVASIAVGIERFSPRLGEAFLRGIVGLPRILGRALAPVIGVYTRVFARLGRIARFTVKVLGITAVINVVADLVRRVTAAFRGLGASIGRALDNTWTHLKISATKAAIAIITPFALIPRKLGGGVFKDIKASLQRQLAGMETDAAKTATNVQSSLNSITGVTVPVTLRIDTTTGRPEEGAAGHQGVPSAASVITGTLAKAQSVFRNALNKAIAAGTKTTGTAADAGATAAKGSADTAKKAAARAKAAATKQRKAFEALLDSIGLQIDKAAVTRGFADDLRANSRLQAAIRKQIGIEGKTTELEKALFDAQQARAQLLTDRAGKARAAREKAAAAVQANQFRALGLTATGDRPTPTIANLRKQLSSITKRIANTPLETSGNRALLHRIRKVLTDPISKATVETRAKIKELFDTLRGTFNQEASQGPLTKTTSLNSTKILAGLGLDRDTEKQLRARLSKFNSGGVALAGGGVVSGSTFSSRPVVVESHTTIKLDSDVVARAITRSQQKTRRRNPPQKRGPGGF